MIQISDKLKTYMRDENGRQFEAKLVVNSSDFPCDIRKLKIKKGSCGSSTFQPGCYFSNSIEAEIRSSNKIKHGDKLEVWLAAPLSGDSNFYKVATAYVRHPINKMKEISFIAEGAISAKLGWEWVGEVGGSINAMINYISTVSGVNITLESGLNGSLVPNQSANIEGMLLREVGSLIASCFFGYMSEDVNGDITIRRFRNDAEESVELSEERMGVLPDIYDMATVHGVQVKNTDTDFVYPEGIATVNCSLNNDLMTEEIFNTYVGDFVGFSYIPYNAELTLGDFTLEPWDNITIEGSRTIFTEIVHTFDGGLRTEINAATIESGSEYTRTEKQMQSTIAYSNYSTALPSVPSIPDSGESEEHRNITDVYVLHTNEDIIGIYKNYMGVIQWRADVDWWNNDWDYSKLKIPAKYMPAYPVTIQVFGFTTNGGSTGAYLSGSSSNYIAIQITLQNYLDANGYVKVDVCASYYSPRDPYFWGNIPPTWMWTDFDDKELGHFNHARFTEFYILANKYDDFINGTL